MKAVFYRALAIAASFLGLWFVAFFAWFVATGYFLFKPSRVGTSVSFYQALFPNRSKIFYYRLAWRQFHRFTSVYVDRLRLQRGEAIPYSSEGFELFEQAIERKTGGVVLMSHLGNWEVAARLLAREGIKLTLIMGIKQKEQIEKMQKDDLAEDGLRIIGVEAGENSPTLGLEARRVLESGGFLALSGDIVWSKGARVEEVAFADRQVRLPAMGHIMALMSKAPIFIPFFFRREDGGYHIIMKKGITPIAETRAMRSRAITESVETYAKELEEACRSRPEQWYHFEPFFTKTDEASQ